MGVNRVWIFLAAVSPAFAQNDAGNSRAIYEATVDSVVAVRALTAGGERSGSGVVLTKDGLLLVSYSVVPEGAKNIRVWMKGPALYRAEMAGSSKRDEITLLRIKPKAELKPIVFGSSARVRVGEVAYTLGNASNSMINNDQPSFNVGIISGIYRLDESRANAHYLGTVFETTAAVNVGMEGGPLLDASGRMIGLVTLNYSPHRFLGNAIPMEAVRYTVDLLREGRHPSQRPATSLEPQGETGAGYLGLRLGMRAGKLVVEGVEPGSPAEEKGLRPGIVILRAGEKSFASIEEFEAFVGTLQAGALLTLTIDDDGLQDEVKILLEKKK